jgi:hypothetical protein
MTHDPIKAIHDLKDEVSKLRQDNARRPNPRALEGKQ